MKTNVLMNRQMGNFNVYQRTSDGYFDANALLRQWNSIPENPNRKMAKFLEAKSTKEFIEVLIQEETHGAEMLGGDFQAFIITRGRRVFQGSNPDKVFMHPYLFIKFALWLNPKFEYQVIKFVYDELIKNRHLAGDNHNKLMSSIQMLGYVDYSHICQGLNYIVFNNHYKNIRNNATEEQLSELHILEDKLSFAIEMGYIRSYQELIANMREIYNRKNTKF